MKAAAEGVCVDKMQREQERDRDKRWEKRAGKETEGEESETAVCAW